MLGMITKEWKYLLFFAFFLQDLTCFLFLHFCQADSSYVVALPGNILFCTYASGLMKKYGSAKDLVSAM